VTPKAIVTDIEGTTSSIAFVHDLLFPYARGRYAAYLDAHPAEVAPILDAVRAEAGADVDCLDQLLQWHDADRKIGPLKALQGLIWAKGYADGALKGHVYPDAVVGLRRWQALGIPLYVYSSGSVAAQKLIFGHTDFGDLTPFFSGYFDTGVGGKKAADSYRVIAQAIGLAPGDILFLSDVGEELDAAREAGFAVTLLARDGVPTETPWPATDSFDAILPAETVA